MDDLAPLPSHPQKRKAASFSSDTPQGAKRIKLDTLLNPFPGDEPHSGQIGIPSFPIAQSSPSATEQRRDSVTDLGDSICSGAAYESIPAPNGCQDSQPLGWLEKQELEDLFDEFLEYPDNHDEVKDWSYYTELDRSLTINDLAITLFQTDQGPPIDRDAVKKDLSEFSIKNLVIDVHESTTPAPTMVDCFSWENPDLEKLSERRLMKIRGRQQGRKSYF
ncbi:hypothetical protein FSARC_14106 [Fusarium sarcochroum]|uniref:Uncharacterized protein n=1 Tax=Fusarium sarcochroum TaxID=1208366 RepID=A0A8H4SWA6_9HYPO|nr:hypothetical protein FSARC_14106 [Fusarium sarcochroum]